MANGSNLGIHDVADGEREFYVMPTRYDPSRDEIVPVTQEWVDSIECQYLALRRARYAARQALLVVDNGFIKYHPELQAFLDVFPYPNLGGSNG